MINLRPPESRPPPPQSSPTTAFSFLSRGWRETLASADADLQLIKTRANSFKTLASSFDRELENFITSASKSTFPVVSATAAADIDFVRRLQPKLRELRRAYSSPDFKGWAPRGRIGINLSAIRNAIVAEEDFVGWDWKEEERGFDWEPMKAFKLRLKEFDRKTYPAEILESIKNSEFVGKVKSSLV